MVIKITKGKSIYSTLAYNLDKVELGVGRVIGLNKIMDDGSNKQLLH